MFSRIEHGFTINPWSHGPVRDKGQNSTGVETLALSRCANLTQLATPQEPYFVEPGGTESGTAGHDSLHAPCRCVAVHSRSQGHLTASRRVHPKHASESFTTHGTTSTGSASGRLVRRASAGSIWSTACCHLEPVAKKISSARLMGQNSAPGCETTTKAGGLLTSCWGLQRDLNCDGEFKIIAVSLLAAGFRPGGGLADAWRVPSQANALPNTPERERVGPSGAGNIPFEKPVLRQAGR